MEYMLKLKEIYKYVPTEVSKARKSHNSKTNHLYVYYDTNTISQIANETNELWFKSPKAFSDKEEHIGWINKFFNFIIKLKSKSFKYNKSFQKLVMDAFHTYDIERYNQRYYICCFSYEPDNNLCWNTFMGNSIQHITKINVKGKYDDILISILKDNIVVMGSDLSCAFEKKYTHGACICFNKSSLDCNFDCGKNIEGGFVCYSSNILTIKFKKWLDSVYKQYRIDNNENAAIVKIHNIIDRCNLFFKNDFYAGEKEFRYVYDSFYETEQDLHILSKEIMKDKIIYKYKFNKSSIRHITITNSNDKKIFENNFKKQIRLSKISFNEENINWYDIGLIYED